MPKVIVAVLAEQEEVEQVVSQGWPSPLSIAMRWDKVVAGATPLAHHITAKETLIQ